MSRFIKEFIAMKRAWRSMQYQLPMSEKARIVERLRHRQTAFRNARAMRAK
jgi:hypothetical protein